MNWIQLRPILRGKFGMYFYFYNDVVPSTGNRRIKICSSQNRDKIFNFIREIAPDLDVNLYGSSSVTIHYKNI